MRDRRVVDCNVCRVTIPEADRVYVEVHGSAADLRHFERGDSLPAQWADFCPTCWQKTVALLNGAKR